MRISEFIIEGKKNDKVDYVIYVNDRPATVYDTEAEARRDLDAVKKKYRDANIVIKQRRRYEEIGEDAGSSPGGVSPNTKMVCEKDPHSEDSPRIRHYKDSYNRDRWEVLDWRGHRVHAFDSKSRAYEYLNKNRYRLEHPEGPLKESDTTDKVWMIEYVPNEEKRKDAPYRQTRRLFYRNHDDAQVAVTKLRNKLADVLGAGAIQVSARGMPPDRIR